MSIPTDKDPGKVIAERLGDLVAREKAAVAKIRDDFHSTRNTNKEFNEKLTFGERVADKVATFGGSWTFIGLFGATLIFWILL